MDIKGFNRYAEDRRFEKEVIEASIKTIEDYNRFLQKSGKDIDTASYEDFYAYSTHLISKRRNTPDTYLGLLRYGLYKKRRELIVPVMEVLDGSEVIENFSQRLINELGQDVRDEIFKAINIPPLGIHPKIKPEFMKKLVQRLEKKIGTERCAKFLGNGLRDRYEEWRQPDREKYLASKNIDEFLESKHENFVKELENHHKNKTLFFTQEITHEVLEFVKNNRHIESGVREGKKIIVEKIPHMAKEYLKEKDEKMRRYYYCHCPWVKEAFLESDKPISPVFCNCSAGYYKAYWEIVFAQPVRVEVLDSLLRGNSVCRFAVHLPEEVFRKL